MTGTRITPTRSGRTFRAPMTSAFTKPFFSSFGGDADFSRQLDEMMRSVFDNASSLTAVDKFPVMNLIEDKNEFTMTAEMAGMNADDVKIDYTDGVLTIKGEKTREETKEQDDRKYYFWERRFGSFQRSIPFPGGVAEDKISAEMKDGVLTVHLPKVEEAKAKRHEVPILTAK